MVNDMINWNAVRGTKSRAGACHAIMGAKGCAAMPQPREVIFEFHRVGNAVKVSAIEVGSGVEVSIVGDPAVGEATLKRLALRKLEYVLAKRQEGADDG